MHTFLSQTSMGIAIELHEVNQQKGSKMKPKIEDLEQCDTLTIDGKDYQFLCEINDCLVMIDEDELEKNIARIFPEEYLDKCTYWVREDTYIFHGEEL